jgi:hypothetical protein
MEKKRRPNTMEEPKKESKIEGIQEIRLAEKADSKVRDHLEMTRELTGLIKENYITGLRLFFSLWEENLKITKEQAEEWAQVHEETTKLMREPFGRFPIEGVNFWSDNSKFINSHVEKIFAFQKDCSRAAMNTSDRFIKETLGLMKNSIDRIFGSFNDYVRFD